jgi:hypothetical protein
MKNLKYLITILAVAVIAVSCETYDDYDTERSTVIGFTTLVGGPNAIVPAGGSLDKQINVFVSDVSNTERSFNVIINAELTEIGPENYSLSPMIIPANERSAVYTVTFTDVNLPLEPTPFSIKFESSASGNIVSGNRAIVQVRRN